MVQNNRIRTPDEFNTLVETAHATSLRQGFTVYLIGRTGLRREEAAHFKPEWFDSANRRIIVPAEQDSWEPQAAHHVRAIPLSDPVAHNIDEYIGALDREAFDVSGSTVYRRVTSAADIDDLPHVTPRLLRQMYRVKLEGLGFPPAAIADITGLRQQLPWATYYMSQSGRHARSQAALDNHWTSSEPDLFGTFPDEFQDKS